MLNFVVLLYNCMLHLELLFLGVFLVMIIRRLNTVIEILMEIYKRLK